MTTKTEYRSYIASEAWQERRKEFLSAYPECDKCKLPRWIAVIAYDQDLHVHHRNYAHVGEELEEDLQPLCKRCHEVETFGMSTLHIPRPSVCGRCGLRTWNRVDNVCGGCEALHPCEDFSEKYEAVLLAKVSVYGETLAEYLYNRVLPDIIGKLEAPQCQSE